ncbi:MULTISPECIES: flagellar hook-associated protein FlgL [unclassified Colwellia]|uniref:flagellar hook-associated protein FlgL n=1 Tax=unclassified Colwellia TaxID=196834 RepID=UPI0015F6A335|nr:MULTISPECIES: flagellar hook-associated protein FlgL [unclassified Colwellia]MBA6233388.1 flagellar hook-associated protein FlgL [Colwellia sp. MB02u-7]MBA6236478.1 flagellar hook-associated protein FlgL [Colwellia sp. MB02u-11]MBA6257012.1 flagellar hook-associated protein FlgL [Colwellia sp. MB3u-28]MBA6260983.1 flagellar hook-associated protein FlgL [Colwellia sp. MB3u-41]MBA6298123.1 flagellar hook-associated protein FlgL [Colwellia sp. MB3u-22]
MRISTSQFYQISANSMSKMQSDLQDQVKYLSAGKQVLTAKDAPIQNISLGGIKEELRSIERFETNITQAVNHNNRQEVSLSNTQDVLMQVQDIFIQANNGAYDDENLKSLSAQLKSNLEQLVDIANTKNETGEYIFSGFQVDQRPFSAGPDNQVTYLGDNKIAELQISTNIRVTKNTPGDDIFMNIDNSVGDFIPSAIQNLTPPADPDPEEPYIYVESAKIVDRQAYNAAAMTPNLTFDFTDTDADGVVDDVTITDGAAVVSHGPVPFIAGQTIAFNGMEVELDGNPLPGDQFSLTPQEKVSVFDTLKSAIDWIDNSIEGTDDPKQLQVDYKYLLTQLDGAFGHITSKRAEVGITLNKIDVQRNVALDLSVMLQSSRGKIEDLDFASAVSLFEQQKMSLQATQQTFKQIEGLSLFNYI